MVRRNVVEDLGADIGQVPGWDITFAGTVAAHASSSRFVLGTSRVSLAEFAPAEAVQRMYPDGKLVSQGTGAAAWVTRWPRWPGWPAPSVTSATPARPHRRRPRRGKRRQLPRRAVHRSVHR